MIDHVTLRALAARARARVLALQADARLIGWAVGVQCALGSATLVRVANIVGRAGTGTSVVLDAAYRVRTARGRCTWSGHARLYVD